MKRSHIEKPCRHHGYSSHTQAGKNGCYYCYRRKLLGQYNNSNMRPEEILLQEIFMSGGRFFSSRPIQKKVRDATRRRKFSTPAPLPYGCVTASWTDGNKIVMG